MKKIILIALFALITSSSNVYAGDELHDKELKRMCSKSATKEQLRTCRIHIQGALNIMRIHTLSGEGFEADGICYPYGASLKRNMRPVLKHIRQYGGSLNTKALLYTSIYNAFSCSRFN